MTKQCNVAIVGATGAVGREVLKTLEQRWSFLNHKNPKTEMVIKSLRLLASSRSAGQRIEAAGQTYTVEALRDSESFQGVDVVFFTAGSKIAEIYAPRAGKAGALVVDNSSLFRMRSDVPLIVPEINSHTMAMAKSHRIIANPNCTTAQMVMVLHPLHKAFRIRRVMLSSYQAVSGKGQQGIEEFQRQIKDFYEHRKPQAEAFPHPIAFNCLPHIDVFQPDGYTGEERKVMNETCKILGDDSMRVVATCVRVPVLNCHSESVYIETERPCSVEAARNLLLKMPGVKVWDDPSQNKYPLAMDVSGSDDVYVGRIRQNSSVENGLALWIVGDNLRKGAALNAVQIAEAAPGEGLL